ncbi:MAG: 50S ribosomal protein L13 [Chloroflexi bacterium]|nr:50S ribosomal protein L13 [Chloroflexota bacterium]
MKTYALKESEIQRDWYVVDAAGQTLGRLATQIATLLRGKHKPTFSTHLDNGDFVVVVNAGQIKVTGNKLEDKKYYRYSGYPGGLRETSLRDMLAKHPERVITAAVKGMLPDNRMGHQLMGKLKVYKTATHPHSAQNPKVWKTEEKQQ